MCIPVPLLWYIYNTQSLIGITFFIVNIFIGIQQLLYPTTKCGWGAIMDSLCHVRPSVHPSVGRSVGPSPLSCLLYKSYTNWRIFFKLSWNVHLNKEMCKSHVAHGSAQGQGHNWRSNIKQSNIRHYVVFAL